MSRPVAAAGRAVLTARPDAWRADVERFFDDVADLMLSGDDRLELLGEHATAVRHIARRAEDVRQSVWNMQWSATVPGMVRTLPLEERARAAGLESRDLFPAEAIAASPLIPSAWPTARLGWVPAPLLVTDGNHAFFSGPRGTRVGGTIWSTEDPGLLRCAVAVFTRCWEAAVPWQQVVDRPALEGRTFRVALEMAQGASDLEIAQRLGVGQRTAAGEVRRVIDWCGARGRGHAIAILVGADR